MQKILKAPYYSQHRNVKNPDWKKKACGMVCVKMVGDFVTSNKFPETGKLISEGLGINAYSIYGWSHLGLVSVLRNHGALAYAQEFRSLDPTFFGADNQKESKFSKKIFEAGINKIGVTIKNGLPV